ncbi:MAG TPA: hypothetical protein VFO84_11045 [Dehalococcoidia bacterium]|nr:hypothetical protein [Dehalococcoidia bacterium]
MLVVWLPMLDGDDEFAVREASGSYLLDPRVSHYWDEEGSLRWRYAESLNLPEDQPAWDIYMLFQQGATWQEEPPKPDFWMHQLNVTTAPSLDPLRLSSEIERLLE